MLIGASVSAGVVAVHIKGLGRELWRQARKADNHENLLADMLKHNEKMSVDIKQLQTQLQKWAAKESKDKGD